MQESNKTLISCIVAIYNVEKYLDECIRSLVDQDYSNVEIILIDDGSTDGSSDICRKYAEKDERIKYIRQDNGGANAARNRGLEVSSGDWIFWCDGDDYVRNDIFTGIEDHLTEDNDLVIFSSVHVKDGKESVVAGCCDKVVIERDDFSLLRLVTLDRFLPVKYNYKYFDAVSIWNKCYRKSFLKENELRFIPGMPKLQDLTFNLCVYEVADRAVYINHPGYCYRYNSESVTNKYQSGFSKKADIIIEWIYNYSKKYLADAEYYKAYCGRVLSLIRTAAAIDYFNKNNNASYKSRKKDFIEFISRNEYAVYLKDADIGYLPRNQKLHSFCIKHRLLKVYDIYCRKIK